MSLTEFSSTFYYFISSPFSPRINMASRKLLTITNGSTRLNHIHNIIARSE
ncbi:hypothetical protein EVA_16305 [gut metagenome]|uniref:Uncharacterized protein n=1 Tax=gut metagenome TaxID=749906 RepID=J9FMD8_9ZZZZ